MKKIIAILLAALMVMGMAACGNSANSGNGEAEKLFVPLFIDSLDSKYAEAIQAGAEDAAQVLGAEVVLCGPSEEVEGDFATLAKTEMKKNPSAVAIASTVVEDAADIIAECNSKNIPIIGFGMGDPADASFNANVYSDINDAASLAARKATSDYVLLTNIRNATPEKPVVIACIASEYNEEVIASFVTTMSEQCEALQPGKISLEGHENWANEIENAAVIIQVSVLGESVSDPAAILEILDTENLKSVFCADTAVLSSILAATNRGADLGSRYSGMKMVTLYDGAVHKSAMYQNFLLGSALDDQYQIGYKAVELAVNAADGAEVEDVAVEFTWVDTVNSLDDEIVLLLYD